MLHSENYTNAQANLYLEQVLVENSLLGHSKRLSLCHSIRRVSEPVIVY